jgi:hypothetical protein
MQSYHVVAPIGQNDFPEAGTPMRLDYAGEQRDWPRGDAMSVGAIFKISE